METVRVLGVVGSPRKNGNTAKLVTQALEGAASVPGIDVEFYELAGKKIHHCIGCLKCLESGKCAFEDDFQEFARKYMEADGIIMGSPVYHMAVPGSMKAALDRLANVVFCNFVQRGKEIPRFSKVCGAVTVGAARHGGQELVLTFLANSTLLMNGVVVAGDSLLGNYIGAGGYLGQPAPALPMTKSDRLRSKSIVVEDVEGMASALNLGKRVAEMARILKAGKAALAGDLPDEYHYTWEEL